MASLNESMTFKARIEQVLTAALAEWETIESVAQDWQTWDAFSKMQYVADWPVKEDHLQQLQAWSDAGQLIPKQQERFQKLLSTVSQTRPIAERLFHEMSLYDYP